MTPDDVRQLYSPGKDVIAPKALYGQVENRIPVPEKSAQRVNGRHTLFESPYDPGALHIDL